MISKSELYRKLRRDIGEKAFRLLTESFIEEILYDESLKTVSEYYPLLVKIKITKDCAIPFQDYNGKVFNFMKYRIPQMSTIGQLLTPESFEWIDIENFYIIGNDTRDVYSGTNIMMSQYFLSTYSSLPHTRSYFELYFEEPDTLILDPPQLVHRNFTVIMQATRTLKTVPRTLRSHFLELVVCDTKLALYNRYAHQSGSQTYGGIEIDTKIEDFANAEGQREKIIEFFEGDWYKNPERYEVINLYNYKS